MKNEWVKFSVKLAIGLGVGGLITYSVTWFLNNSYIFGNGLYINF